MPEIFRSPSRQSISPSPEVPQYQASPTPEVGLHRNVDDYSHVMRNEKPSSNPFDAFAAKPQSVTFDSQLRDEIVILLLRQHPITQIKWFVIGLAMIFLPVLFNFVQLLDFLPPSYQFASLLGWYMLVVGFSLEAFLNWFYNVYIISDERIIDVDFESLIYKNISAAKIENIEDVTATTGGALRSVFDYGSIKIQTAAAVGEFEFADVPHPGRVTTLINELLLEEEREKLEGRVN